MLYSPNNDPHSSSNNKMKLSEVFSSKKHMKLKTSDGKIFEVETKVMAAQSLTIRKYAAKFFSPRTMVLAKIDSRTLSRVVDYSVNKHTELVQKFDERLFFDLIKAAAELEIHGLIDTLCLLAPDVLRKPTYDDVKELLDFLNTKAKAAAEPNNTKFGCLRIHA